MAELVPNGKSDEVACLTKFAIDAGFNDFYLRSAEEEKIQEIFKCDSTFARGLCVQVPSQLMTCSHCTRELKQ